MTEPKNDTGQKNSQSPDVSDGNQKAIFSAYWIPGLLALALLLFDLYSANDLCTLPAADFMFRVVILILDYFVPTYLGAVAVGVAQQSWYQEQEQTQGIAGVNEERIPKLTIAAIICYSCYLAFIVMRKPTGWRIIPPIMGLAILFLEFRRSIIPEVFHAGIDKPNHFRIAGKE